MTVAVAANFQALMAQATERFENRTGIHVVTSLASTAQLAHQIENGAPFDLFLSADRQHIDGLAQTGHIVPNSRRLFAMGSLAMWVPDPERSRVHSLADLKTGDVRLIAVANPQTAPYGEAAVEALKSEGIWKDVEPKITYTTNVAQAHRLAATGNAEVALTAASLLIGEKKGLVIPVNGSLHRPLEHVLGVVTHARNPQAARQFAAFLTGPDGVELLTKYGYIPASGAPRASY
ncbi:MAG TPA: molybdate ABC transporter substrate-binding protein [Bryobacteraceae bacterium]|nr:molybdate ABC transporter substrate-binding protein [Bryobacteraceae bacterium]